MSLHAVQAGYFSSVENNENQDGAAKVRVKAGDVRETRLPVQGKRTVLGTLTNKPLPNVSQKPKQVKTTDSFVFPLSIYVLELSYDTI